MNRAILAVQLVHGTHNFAVQFENLEITAAVAPATEWCSTVASYGLEVLLFSTTPTTPSHTVSHRHSLLKVQWQMVLNVLLQRLYCRRLPESDVKFVLSPTHELMSYITSLFTFLSFLCSCCFSPQFFSQSGIGSMF